LCHRLSSDAAQGLLGFTLLQLLMQLLLLLLLLLLYNIFTNRTTHYYCSIRHASKVCCNCWMISNRINIIIISTSCCHSCCML
jgi:hypothetical protein